MIVTPDLITAEYVKTVLKKRERDIHKGDCGKVLVIAGTRGMAGAAILCGKAALRSGAGLVRVAVSEELFPIIQTALPEATCVEKQISPASLKAYDAIAIGPGLGEHNENEELTLMILKEFKKTVIIDADGLNALARAGEVGALKYSQAKVVITPHMGEAKRLIPGYADADRLTIADMLVQETGSVVVLKGADTIVASPSETMYFNTTGNPGMATGGSGDVLTGMIAALAGQTGNTWDSAKAGVFLHGLAGDIASEKFGEYGLIAGDIAEAAAFAIKKMMD